MAVPAHDIRDGLFAKTFGVPIREVIEPVSIRTKDESDQVRTGQPFAERRAVVAVIKHWSEEKYLGVSWNGGAWKGFVIGGIDQGEDAKTAALREIEEETGYKNIEFVKMLGGKIHSKFYQAVKKENRFAHFEPMLFRLKSGDQGGVTEDEKKLHKVEWLTPKQMEAFVTHEDMHLVWNRVTSNDPYTGAGILVNSGSFSGMDSEEAKKKITEAVGGKWKVTYKLRDWIFSRQRYWGEPIPVIHCPSCGSVPVPEKDLPVVLPKVKNYKPTPAGDSPLATIASWVNVKCPKCKGGAKRETDTMPNWAGSSWYFLRYTDPKNKKAFASKEDLKYFLPVDWYNGGMEHTTLHLLYSRFWHKFLYDLKLVPTTEPYAKRTSHGFILGEGGVKMSKSLGNVVNPDDVVKSLGADTLRLYEMFMGPFEQQIAWSTDGLVGARRFIERVWRLQEKVNKKVVSSKEQLTLLNKTIKKVSEDIEALKMNTAVSALMILANDFEKRDVLSLADYKILIKLLSPIAPHITDELWSLCGGKECVHEAVWPQFDSKLLEDEMIHMAVQINGKVRGTITLSPHATESEALTAAQAVPEINRWFAGTSIKKTIYVPGKILNLVL
jgi:leucyl-tRNA synthetase